jgi:hypothetical protein
VVSSHSGPSSLFSTLSSALNNRSDLCTPRAFSTLPDVEFVSASAGQVTLHQSSFIKSIVAAHGDPSGARPSHRSNQTPADASSSDGLIEHVSAALSPDRTSSSDLDAESTSEFLDLILALSHCASCTRPDVAYAVGMLCRCLHCPTTELHDDARRVLYYLERHADIGLTYDCSDAPLSGMSDSDWAVRHSTTGWVFSYKTAAISWGSTIQDSIALSSCEAEIMAASSAADEAIHLRAALAELHLSPGEPTSLGVDNKAARDLAYNPEHHEKTKHIARRYFWIRDLVEAHRLTVPYVNTLDNMADFFTKPLAPKSFFHMRDHIMNVTVPAS